MTPDQFLTEITRGALVNTLNEKEKHDYLCGKYFLIAIHQFIFRKFCQLTANRCVLKASL